MTELAILATNPSALESARDPGEFVVLACQRAKEWLVEAVEHGDIEQIVELKSQAEAVRVYTAQKQLGKDAELAAAEIVRRAERGIGLAIRKGQEAGEITKQHVGGGPRAPYQQIRNGKQVTVSATRDERRRATAISPRSYLSSGSDGAMTYAVTDGVSDDEFEEALGKAQAEGNLTRANVVRKVRGVSKAPGEAAKRREAIAEMAGQGYSSRQMSARLGITAERVRDVAREHNIDIRADAVIAGSRHHDSNRIVQETVSALEGLAIGARLVDVGGLDRSSIPAWLDSMRDSLRTLNSLRKQLQELT